MWLKQGHYNTIHPKRKLSSVGIKKDETDENPLAFLEDVIEKKDTDTTLHEIDGGLCEDQKF